MKILFYKNFYYNIKMNIKLDDIINLGKPEVLRIQAELSSFYKKNMLFLIDRLEQNDIVAVKAIYQRGLDWSDIKNWEKIAKIWMDTSSSFETVKFIYNLTPDEICIKESVLDLHWGYRQSNLNNSKTFKFDNEGFKKIKDNQKFFRNFLDYSFEKRMESSSLGINRHLAKWMLNKNKDNFANSSQCLNSFCLSISKNNLLEDLDIVEEIVKAHPRQAFFFLDNVSNSDYFNELINSSIVIKIINKNDVQAQQSIIKNMNNAIERGNLQQITFYHRLGISFPDSKSLYSSLISKSVISNKQLLSAMIYVVNNIPDIKVENNVILRTALHYDRLEIMPYILNRYGSHEVSDLNLFLLNRKPSQSLDLVKIAIFNKKLEDNLPEKKATSSVKI